MNWTIIAELSLTVALVAATGALAYFARQEKSMKERDLQERATPRVKAWVGHNWKRSVPTLELIIANLGEGPAQNVKWWFEDVDLEDWEKRIELINWPDLERNASSTDFLRSGEEIRLVLAAGRDLYAPTGTSDRRQSTHYPVKPFTVALSYEALPRNAGERPTQVRERKRVAPVMAYPLNTGAPDPGHRLADAVERGVGRGPAWYGQHPDKGRAASAPRNPDWEEQAEAMKQST